MRLFLCLALLAMPVPVVAQTARPANGSEIIVRGGTVTDEGKPIAMSGWRVAETDNVLVYADASESRLVPIAYNLQKLHFLLDVLLGRVNQPDDTLKVRVTLIGGEKTFDNLDLPNTRWQMGPYPWQIPDGRYYDPREDGAVMAVPNAGQKIILEQGYDIRNLLIITYAQEGSAGADAMAGFDRNKVDTKVNEISFGMSMEGRIYATYAQHYLMTYFPAAYPRWYLDGFGEIFATMSTRDGMIEYGQAPDGLGAVLDKFGRYPISKLLDGSYLDPEGRTRWTPYHAWALAHLMFFSDEWREPLQNYLHAVERGASEEEQRAALGDVGALQAAVNVYRGRKIPYEQMTYPPEMVEEPAVRQLTRSEAAYVKGKLELGARLELPPEPEPGADAKIAAKMIDAREDAIKRRDSWMRDLRETASRYPEDIELQLLLAEAECRSGNDLLCIQAADQVLAVAPDRPEALLWKGTGMAQYAIAGPAANRTAALAEARKLIVRANRGDPDSIPTFLAYYRSFTDAGLTPNDAAALGLIRANEAVPSATVTRLMLAEEYARRGDEPAARVTVRPVAIGAYHSPEQQRALGLLETLTE